MKNQKGQALIETALVIPLLLLLVMGLFEFGRAMYIKNTLNNAARAGARAAVVTPKYDITTNPTGLDATTAQTLNISCNFPDGPNSKVFQFICDSIYNGIPKDEVAVDIVISDLDPLVAAGLSHGDNVKVKLTWGNFKPVLPNLIPISNTIVGEASMRYE